MFFMKTGREYIQEMVDKLVKEAINETFLGEKEKEGGIYESGSYYL